MDYLSSLKWRYATKKFDSSKKVDRNTLDRILEAGNLTATSLGLQAVRVIRVDKKELRDAMLPHCFNQRQVLDASDVLVLCVDKEISSSTIDKYVELISKTRGQQLSEIDGFKNMVSGYVNSFNDQSSMQEWLSKQSYITLGTLLTACALEKVDSCPMEGFKPVEVSKVLNLDEMGLIPTLILPIGYRSVEDGNQHLTKVRKSMDDFVTTI